MEVEDEFETQLSRYNCFRVDIKVQRLPMRMVIRMRTMPELSMRPGFECSFAHWYLCFPKFHWRRIEFPSRQVLDGMAGKVNESKESAKIRPFNKIKML